MNNRGALALLLALAGPAVAQAPTPPAAAPAWFTEAGRLLEAGRAEEARAAIEGHLAQVPADADACYLLGVVHERRRDPAAARTAYETALGHDPKLAEAHDRLGFLLGQAGKTEEAIGPFREAARLKPSLFDAWYHLGATLWWAKQPGGALPALPAAVELPPKDAGARLSLRLVL